MTGVSARGVAAHAVPRRKRAADAGRRAVARVATIVRLAGRAIEALAAAPGYAVLSSRALGVGRASEAAVEGGRIAGKGRTGFGCLLRAFAVAVAGEDSGHAIPLAGTGLAQLALLVVRATSAPAVAGSVRSAGRLRTCGAFRRIGGIKPGWNEGTGTQGAAQIAGFAGLLTGRVATVVVHAESGPALLIAGTGFALSLGLADHTRQAGVGLPGVRAFGVILPAVVHGDEVGERATSGLQDRGQSQRAQEDGLPKREPRLLSSNSPRIGSHWETSLALKNRRTNHCKSSPHTLSRDSNAIRQSRNVSPGSSHSPQSASPAPDATVGGVADLPAKIGTAGELLEAVARNVAGFASGPDPGGILTDGAAVPVRVRGNQEAKPARWADFAGRGGGIGVIEQGITAIPIQRTPYRARSGR